MTLIETLDQVCGDDSRCDGYGAQGIEITSFAIQALYCDSLR